MAKCTIREVLYMGENEATYLIIIEGRSNPIFTRHLSKEALLYHLKEAMKYESYGVHHSTFKFLNNETLIEADSKEELIQLTQMHQLMN